MVSLTHEFHELIAQIDQIKAMQGRGGYFNRAARRSGGHNHFATKFGTNVDAVKKNLSIQCFEQRHRYCTGTDPFFGYKCDCKCHQKQP